MRVVFWGKLVEPLGHGRSRGVVRLVQGQLRRCGLVVSGAAGWSLSYRERQLDWQGQVARRKGRRP